MSLTQVSLFTGIGGFDFGFERAGFESVLQCELDANCRSVLERHWPGVERESDVRNIGVRTEPAGRSAANASDGPDEGTERNAQPDVSVLHFGSPCQDLSVAGKRAGLAGSRSGLFHEAVRVIGALRPEFAVWENVGGAYSSDLGRDFGVALDSLAEAGAMDIAWRFLDAQWFGLAQRRGRVFVVADFRGERAGQILLEPEGVPGNPPARREAGQEAAASVGGGVEAASWDPVNVTSKANRTRVEYGLPAQTLHQGGLSVVTGVGIDVELAKHHPKCEWVRGTVEGIGPHWPCTCDEAYVVAKPLAGHHPRTDLDNETYVVRTAQTSANGHGIAKDVTHTLDGAEGQAVYVPEVAYTVTAREAKGVSKRESQTTYVAQGRVRRLTPTECERLQGFPDGWTRYGADGKEMSDTARYRMLGNAVAVPVAEWLAWRIRYAVEANP